MPGIEITQSEHNQFLQFQALGTPGEVRKKLDDLLTDNGKQRDEIRDLKLLVPKDGEVVVKKADADLLTAYRELGEPKEIKGKLEKGEQAAVDAHAMKQRIAATAFAKAAGLAEESVETLVAIPALLEAKFEVKKGKVKDAKGVEVDGELGYITLGTKDAKPMTFVEAQDAVPALKGLRVATKDTKPTGQPILPQGSGNGAPGTTVYDKIREERKPKEDKSKPAATSVEDRLNMNRG